MTLGQFILLVLVVVVFWLGKKSKKHEDKLDEFEKRLGKK